VRRSERVVDVEIGKRRELRGKGRIVGLFAGMEANVLKQQHVAVAQRCDRGFGGGATVSSENATPMPRRSASAAATGRNEYFALRTPSGRPRWDTTIVRAPRSCKSAIVLIAASTRVKSATAPSFIGTLRSSRTRTRLPRTSRSPILRKLTPRAT